MNSKNVLIIFSKSPDRGKVKTRLIPQLGIYKATRIYKELLGNTIKTAINANYSELQIWVDGDINHIYLTQLKKRYGIKLYQQTGNNLGQRMSNAFDKVLNKFTHAVLIGSDCPQINKFDLNKASQYLSENTDVVLGPATDGGYYLIGLKSNNNKLFQNIKWGQASVFGKTCETISNLGWKKKCLSEHWDLDRSSDFSNYLKRNNNL